MQEYILNDGLCSTCKFSSSCMFRKDYLESVHFCEEYEQAEASQQTTRARISPGSFASAGINENKSLQPIMGLCSNCIHQKCCSFPKPESGVWHCEEYQ
jgi:hypothetical protein